MSNMTRKQVLRVLSLSYQKKTFLDSVQPSLLLLWHWLWNRVQSYSLCHTKRRLGWDVARYDNDKDHKTCFFVTWLNIFSVENLLKIPTSHDLKIVGLIILLLLPCYFWAFPFCAPKILYHVFFLKISIKAFPVQFCWSSFPNLIFSCQDFLPCKLTSLDYVTSVDLWSDINCHGMTIEHWTLNVYCLSIFTKKKSV